MHVFNWNTLLGNVQYGYVQSENSILKGSFDILESKGKSFGSIGDNYQLGPAWGGSGSYLHINTSSSPIPILNWFSSVDVLKGTLGASINPKGSDSAYIEGGARGSLVERATKNLTYKIQELIKNYQLEEVLQFLQEQVVTFHQRKKVSLLVGKWEWILDLE